MWIITNITTTMTYFKPFYLNFLPTVKKKTIFKRIQLYLMCILNDVYACLKIKVNIINLQTLLPTV